MSKEGDRDRLVAGGETCKKLTSQVTGKGGVGSRADEMGKDANKWFKTNGLTSECRLCQPSPDPISPTSYSQEKLQKCLAPLEQKLQEITRCKSSEEQKPAELKVKAGNEPSINTLFNSPVQIH